MGWEEQISAEEMRDREIGVVEYAYDHSATPKDGCFNLFTAFTSCGVLTAKDGLGWGTKDGFYASMKKLMENGNLTDLNNELFVKNGQKANDADVDRMFEEMQRGNVLLVNKPRSEEPEKYPMKLSEPLFDKETNEINLSATISHTSYPISEKQHEMLKMTPDDAQKALDSLGDPPKRASIFTRPFRSLYHMIKGDYKPFSKKLAEYNDNREAYNSVIERGKKFAAKNPSVGEEIKVEEKIEVKVEEKVEIKENVKTEPEKEVVNNAPESEVKESVKTDDFLANSGVTQLMGKAVTQTMTDYLKKYSGASPDNVAAGGKAIIDYIQNEDNIEKPECERLIKTLALGNNSAFKEDSAKYSKFQKEYETLLANIGKTINEEKLANKDGDAAINSDTVVEQAIEKYMPGVEKTDKVPTNIVNQKQVNWEKIGHELNEKDNPRIP